MIEYLTEYNLGLILNEIFPNNDFVHDKSVPNSLNKRRRPDFRSDKRKLIIEFDGDSHYCKAERIKIDFEKDLEYVQLGYKVFRIPYFVQITTELIKDIFNENIQFKQRYPNGFIDSKAMLPANYCELGIVKFKKDLEWFSYHSDEIITSLKNKVEEMGDIDLVLPPSLRSIIN